MANFPVSLDNGTSLPTPAAGNNTNNPSHAGLHAAENAAIIAAETKLGTGASVPASATLLIGTGAGTSAWSGITSAQLAAILSDETGSGSAVFATTPTLITPKVDTINESTPGNGVTVGGVSLKSNNVNAPGTVTAGTGLTVSSGPVNVPTNSLTAPALATNAITLGYAEITTPFTASSATLQDVTGLSITVTVPAGGRRLEILSWVPQIYSSVDADRHDFSIEEDGVQLTKSYNRTWTSANGGNGGFSVIASKVPTAASHTYKLRVSRGSGTGVASVYADTTSKGFITARLV